MGRNAKNHVGNCPEAANTQQEVSQLRWSMEVLQEFLQEDPSGERGQTHSQDCLRKCAATAAAQRQGILGRGASGDELFMAWDEDGKRGHVCEAHYRLDGMLRANVD